MIPNSESFGQYRTALNRIHLAYASLLFWCHPDSAEVFESIYEAMDVKIQLFPAAKHLVRDEKAMKIVCDGLYVLAYRSAIVDLLPVTG